MMYITFVLALLCLGGGALSSKFQKTENLFAPLIIIGFILSLLTLALA